MCIRIKLQSGMNRKKTVSGFLFTLFRFLAKLALHDFMSFKEYKIEKSFFFSFSFFFVNSVLFFVLIFYMIDS